MKLLNEPYDEEIDEEIEEEIEFPEKNKRRGARRKKDLAKARRTKELYYRWSSEEVQKPDHAFVKAKAHCSCPRCAFRYKKKGRKPVESVTAQDMRNNEDMDEQYFDWLVGVA